MITYLFIWFFKVLFTFVASLLRYYLAISNEALKKHYHK